MKADAATCTRLPVACIGACRADHPTPVPGHRGIDPTPPPSMGPIPPPHFRDLKVSQPKHPNSRKGNPKMLAALKPHQWKPGQSGNPAGSAPGRVTLQTDFWKTLAEDFKLHGKDAVVKARELDPVKYVQVVAQLMPKEIDIKHAVDGMSDEELDAAIAELRSLARASRAGEAAGAEGGGAQAPGVPTVQ